ncbi:MAG: hypothetical protein RIC35_19875 [Marinoscillum sp.]
MKQLKWITMGLIFGLLVSLKSYAQGVKPRLSAEVDPATFGMKGYSLHLRLQPAKSEHILMGLGTYAMNMPDLIVNFNKANKDQGWGVRIRQGYSLFGEYYFSEVNDCWFVGSQVGMQQFKLSREEVADKTTFTNWLAMGYFGYSWKLFDSHFYLKPWAGVGYTSKVSGSERLGDALYDIAPVTMFATFHVGYTF